MKLKFLLLTFCLLSLGAFSKSAWEKKYACANRKFEKRYLLDASKTYEALLNDKKVPADSVYTIKTRLAKSYELMGSTLKAEAIYAELVKQNPTDRELRFSYARMLEANNKALSAKNNFLLSDNSSSAGFARIADQVAESSFTNTDIQVEPVSFNTRFSEYAPAMYKKGIVFTSNRGARNTQRNGWNGERYSALMIAEENNAGGTRNARLFSQQLKSKFNSGTATFSLAGDEIFFSRNNCKKKYRDHLAIVSSTNNGSWSKPKAVSFVKPDYNYTHPSLSGDGRTLYFASDMPGGSGGMDIWMSRRNDTAWATPVNVGAPVNTAGNELFPFIADNGALYFASNGHAGAGGLDIFITKPDSSGQFGSVTNLQMPVNSSKDDFGIITDATNTTGYFSSNRGGNDDIYRFYQGKQLYSQAENLITWRIVDMGDESNNYEIRGLQGAVVTVAASTGRTSSYRSDKDGYFDFMPMPGTSYDIDVTKTDYEPVSIQWTYTAEEAAKKTQHLTALRAIERVSGSGAVGSKKKATTDNGWITPVTYIVKKGETLNGVAKKFNVSAASLKKWNNLQSDNVLPGTILTIGYGYDDEIKDLLGVKEMELAGVDKTDRDSVIEFIKQYHANKITEKGATVFGTMYFDFNSRDLTLSKTELEILVGFLKDHKNVNVEVVGNTDNIGTWETNFKLSVDRAKNVYDYLIAKDIPASRLIYNGKGSTVPVASNDTDEGRAKNRRVDIVLIK